MIGPVGTPLPTSVERTQPAQRIAHPLDWLIPGRDALGLALLLAAAVAIGVGVGVLRGGAHLGGVLALVLGALSYALAVGRVAGAGVALLALLLVAQAGHSVEHVVQLVQVYLLDLPGIASQGFLVVANVELVHATWSSGVALGAIALIALGLRTPWAWVLLLWSLAHAGEHGYLLVRALQVQAAMADLGLPAAPAVQALPGILGRDGWLATSPFASWCSSVPGLVTAPRPVVHFVWNSGEMLLLVAAAGGWRRRRSPPGAAPYQASSRHPGQWCTSSGTPARCCCWSPPPVAGADSYERGRDVTRPRHTVRAQPYALPHGTARPPPRPCAPHRPTPPPSRRSRHTLRSIDAQPHHHLRRRR